MSQLLNVISRIEKAQERQKDLGNQLKDLKKRARDLSLKTHSQADRLAGRAFLALVAAGKAFDSAAVLARATELARPADTDALQLLTERLVERIDDAAPSASQAGTDTAETFEGFGLPPTATASSASHSPASASDDADDDATATSTADAPAGRPETVDTNQMSAARPDGALSSLPPAGFIKPLRRIT